jgi:1-acyl-sn-glycerol-3-phosphate acyltransferase
MNIIRSTIFWLLLVGTIILFFPLSFLVWMLVYPFDHNRVVIHWWLVYEFCLLSKLMPVWRIEIEGGNKALKNTPYIIISNHQSLLDILILHCLRYRWKWISKIENSKIPFLGWYMLMAEYIYVDRGNKDSKAEMMGKCEQNLRKGISILMFPEGTRSKDKEIGPFKLGAFQLALMTDKSILPVVLDGTGGILPKNGLLFTGKSNLKIRVLDPVHPGTFGTANPEELALKFRNLMVDELQKMREVIKP